MVDPSSDGMQEIGESEHTLYGFVLSCSSPASAASFDGMEDEVY